MMGGLLAKMFSVKCTVRAGAGLNFCITRFLFYDGLLQASQGLPEVYDRDESSLPVKYLDIFVRKLNGSKKFNKQGGFDRSVM